MKKYPKNKITLTPETRASHRAGEGIEISDTNFDICNAAIGNISGGELALFTVGSNYVVTTTVDNPSRKSKHLKEILELAINTKSELHELERLTVALNMLTRKIDARNPPRAPGVPSHGTMHWLAQRYKQPNEGARGH